MIGLDSNILLRAIANDDRTQSPQARRLLDGLTPDRQGCINVVVLVEIAWSLSRKYKRPRSEIMKVVDSILASSSYHVVERDAVSDALLASRRHGIDFPDALIAAINVRAGASLTHTFDKSAVADPAFSLVQAP